MLEKGHEAYIKYPNGGRQGGMLPPVSVPQQECQDMQHQMKMSPTHHQPQCPQPPQHSPPPMR